MCALLQVEPEAILPVPEDAALVRDLIEQERNAQKKDPAAPGEVSPAKQALLNMIDDMSEEQLAKLLPIVREAQRLL